MNYLRGDPYDGALGSCLWHRLSSTVSAFFRLVSGDFGFVCGCDNCDYIAYQLVGKV